MEVLSILTEELQKIYNALIEKKERKANIARIKANAELEAIQREEDAYCDGVYDALRAVENAGGGDKNAQVD